MRTMKLFYSVMVVGLLSSSASEVLADDVRVSPTPLGYTDAEWRDLLESAVVTGTIADMGGLEVYVIGVDEPLSFEGTGEPIKFVPLDPKQMAILGVEAGDDETALDSFSSSALDSYLNPDGGRTVFINKDESQYSDLGDSSQGSESFSESSASSGVSPVPLTTYTCTSSNYWCQLWNDENGSGLLVNNQSYIQITGRAESTTSDRYGTARFYNDRNSEYAYLSCAIG